MRSLHWMFGIGILAGSAALTACGGSGNTLTSPGGTHDGGGGGTGGTAGSSGTGGTAGGGGTGGTAGSSGTGGGGGTGGAGNEAGTCNPKGTPKDNPCAVSDAYGVFIDATGGSDTTGNGTEQKPYKTFAKGVAEATSSKKRLFACAGTYAESVQLVAANNGIEMYGGFSCSDWSFSNSNKTKVAPGTHGPALSIDKADGVHIEDIAFTSSDATHPGDSSVAASVSQSKNVQLYRVTLTASKGAKGRNGATIPTGVKNGTEGNKGTDQACTVNGNPGGAAVSTTCGTVTSVGGKGGDGAFGAGNDGGDGANGQPFATTTGIGGNGQNTKFWSCAVGNGNGGGQNGKNGAAGTSGAGGTGLGKLTAGGVSGMAGKTGTAGTPGQGGGGGGGAQPGFLLSCVGPGSGSKTGASGGSGGTGGCGGKGGNGGGAGGSSIALISIDSDIAMHDCTLIADQGGDGGGGAHGQNGGNGGQGAGGGNGSFSACRGGNGGHGGHGGHGGGGHGGHSLAIAYLGAMPSADSTTTMTESSTAAKGGLGGGSASSQGAGGLSKDLQKF